MPDYKAQMSLQQAFARYEAVRHRLPTAHHPATSAGLPDLSAVAAYVDAFVLDAFGVLNVGQTPIPGAPERIAGLRKAGKKLLVLTNAASDTRQAALEKYQKLGFDFSAEEVVSSRDVCGQRLAEYSDISRWGAISTQTDSFVDLPATVVSWTAQNPAEVDGFLLLSSAQFSPETYGALVATLRERPRPVLVANPDIVAPREAGLSQEPGFFAHKIADEVGLEPVFFGKPFGNAFEDALARLRGIKPDRIAMVGDTLHTDVLGGAAAGFKTVLIQNYGLFAGADTDHYIELSGIRPDFICPVT